MFGLIFGSFLNVCIYRMPRELSVVRPRSACPACSAPIAAYDNIPVFSWLILQGKCRQCKTPISPRYAAVELLTGILFASSWLYSMDNLPLAIKSCVLCFLLVGLVFTDAETKLLPDLLTWPGLVAGLVFSLLVSVDGFANLLLRRWGTLNWHILSFSNAFMGAFFGAGFILGVALLYEAVRNVEGIGMGDVKLMGMIGAFIGVKLTLLVLLLGSLIGSLFGGLLMVAVWRRRLARRKARRSESPAEARSRAWQSAKLIFRNFEVPFGVFLGVAALVAFFWGNGLVRWYVGMF
ncbi:MAG TPA: prepilin peptidase [Candidatus Saccharimonadales bacterium]|nr:prepilin peptidase [Candidatus Saccharimonadales bacterium]